MKKTYVNPIFSVLNLTAEELRTDVLSVSDVGIGFTESWDNFIIDNH